MKKRRVRIVHIAQEHRGPREAIEELYLREDEPFWANSLTRPERVRQREEPLTDG